MRPMFFCIIALNAVLQSPNTDANLQEPIRVIRRVEPGGKGSSAAATAWRRLVKADAGRVTEILSGMDGADSLARNWLSSAAEQVAQAARLRPGALPTHKLEEFLGDRRHDPQARRLAYHLLCDQDAATKNRFLPGMLDDPCLELRHEAIDRILAQAEKPGPQANKEELLGLYRKAFAAAREKDQLDRAARKLRELGEKIDLPTHLGLIADWNVIGAFPNPGKKGIDTAYPPEEKIDVLASYTTQAGQVRWRPCVSTDDYGLVNLNKAIGELQEAVAYATTEFTSEAPRDVEIRVGCYTPFKVWINGQLVLNRGDAYTGMSFDHYLAPAHLKAGRNEILVKVVKDLPAPGAGSLWQFQLRVCDSSGAAVLSTTRTKATTPEKNS